jgi:hypothetical protein
MPEMTLTVQVAQADNSSFVMGAFINIAPAGKPVRRATSGEVRVYLSKLNLSTGNFDPVTNVNTTSAGFANFGGVSWANAGYKITAIHIASTASCFRNFQLQDGEVIQDSGDVPFTTGTIMPSTFSQDTQPLTQTVSTNLIPTPRTAPRV